MTLLRRAARLLSTVLLGLAVLGLLSVTLGPRLLHYRTATMLTASMSPSIRPGDVIIDTPLALSDVRVGQVLTYHIPVDDHRVVSHRVIEVQRPGQGILNIRTQGDANTAPDPWTATLSGNTVWQVRAVIPRAGTAIRALRVPMVHTMLTGAVPALVLCWLLLGIWRPAKPVEADPPAGSDQPTEPAGSDQPLDAHQPTEPAGSDQPLDAHQPTEADQPAQQPKPTAPAV